MITIARIRLWSVKEIIFCEGRLSFKKIIELAGEIPQQIKIKFHALCSESIVGSDSKDVTGKFISYDKQLRLSMSINRRNKNLIDALVSLLFLVTFPVHFILQRKPLRFFKNVFDVLLLRKTWIGYATANKKLPVLKKGILTTTGLPSSLNNLSNENLSSFDEWYARDYTVWQDAKLIRKDYKYLSA